MAKIEQRLELSRYTINSIKQQRKTRDYYPNGSDNVFSNYLDGLYNNSPTHQCIIDDLTFYLIGGGLVSDVEADNVILNEFFNKRELHNIIRSYWIQKTISIEVRKSLNKVIGIDYINPTQLRVLNLEKGEPNIFGYKEDWNPQSPLGNRQKKTDLPSYGSDDDHSILYWYDAGTFNVPYGRPSYISATDSIELEISIYMMHNHGAQNGMFPSMIASYPSSGDPTQDEATAENIRNQATGVANAGKIITIPVPQGAETPTFSSPNLTGLDKIYENQYQVSEAGILKAHRIPSPSLISGLNTKTTGFASPEDEMQWAKNELVSKIIDPNRDIILNVLAPLFEELELKGTVTFEDLETDNIETVEVEENLSKENPLELEDIINGADSIEDLKGWKILKVEDATNAEGEKQYQFASSGVARSNAKSSQDGTEGNEQYKIRYRYSGDKSGQREFCNLMLRFNKLYRYEDIVNMSFSNVNVGFGIDGANNYDIFSYKGGPNCKHKWERVTFVKEGLEGGIDVKSGVFENNTLSETEADSKGMTPTGTAKKKDEISQTKPYDMPNHGYYRLSKIGEELKKLKSLWQ